MLYCRHASLDPTVRTIMGERCCVRCLPQIITTKSNVDDHLFHDMINLPPLDTPGLTGPGFINSVPGGFWKVLVFYRINFCSSVLISALCYSWNHMRPVGIPKKISKREIRMQSGGISLLQSLASFFVWGFNETHKNVSRGPSLCYLNSTVLGSTQWEILFAQVLHVSTSTLNSVGA